MREVLKSLVRWQDGWAYVFLPVLFLFALVAIAGVIALPLWFGSSFIVELRGHEMLSPWPFWAASFIAVAPIFARILWPWLTQADPATWNT